MATPFLVQRVDYPVFQSGSTFPDLFAQSGKIKFKLPNPSPGGNLVVVGFSWGDQTTTWAASDDGGNTYTATTSFATANGDTMQIFFTPNCAANTQVITLTPTPGSLPNHTQGVVAEFGNISTAADPRDIGQQTGGGTGTSVTTAALVTTVDNDLILQFAINESGAAVTSVTAGSSPWTFGGVDIMDAVDSHFWQWQVQTTHGSITPTMTQAPSSAWSSVAISFKSAAAGNALPAGMKVTDMQGNANDNATGRTSPFTIQFPCPAGTNLLVGVWIGVTGDLNSVSDSINGAWTSAGAGVSNGASGTVHIYYKAGATGGTNMTVTLTTAAATSAGDTFDIFAVVGAATSPFDVFASTTGNQATVAQYDIVSITPTTANGVVFAAVGVASGNTGPDTWTPGFWAPPDENNAWGMFYNPNTSAVQFKVTPTNPPNVAPGLWTSQAAAFKAPASGIIFESLPDDGEQFRGVDPTPRMLAMDDWLPLVPRPPLFEWDESQRWQLCREARWSQATAEIDTGLLPIIPKIVYDDDPSRSFEIRSKQDDEPWHTFFLIPVPPPTRGWDDWDWSRDFSTGYAKPPEAEPFDFSAPITPAFGWFEDSPVFSGNAGSLAGMVVLDEFVNAPAAPVFGPAPRGRSVRFGFSISSFR